MQEDTKCKKTRTVRRYEPPEKVTRKCDLFFIVIPNCLLITPVDRFSKQFFCRALPASWKPREIHWKLFHNLYCCEIERCSGNRYIGSDLTFDFPSMTIVFGNKGSKSLQSKRRPHAESF